MANELIANSLVAPDNEQVPCAGRGTHGFSGLVDGCRGPWRPDRPDGSVANPAARFRSVTGVATRFVQNRTLDVSTMQNLRGRRGGERIAAERSESASQNSFLIPASQKATEPRVSSGAKFNTFETAIFARKEGTFERGRRACGSRSRRKRGRIAREPQHALLLGSRLVSLAKQGGSQDAQRRGLASGRDDNWPGSGDLPSGSSRLQFRSEGKRKYLGNRRAR